MNETRLKLLTQLSVEEQTEIIDYFENIETFNFDAEVDEEDYLNRSYSGTEKNYEVIIFKFFGVGKYLFRIKTDQWNNKVTVFIDAMGNNNQGIYFHIYDDELKNRLHDIVSNKIQLRADRNKKLILDNIREKVYF